ncbi:radical SAM family heme chaperone HemW [Hoylesella pleuritidis]|uniref:Heme chaperone HemW n=1 Tax=Hoylesella pleuritidis F0068 TaxID=1081904 RepID=U2MAR4_9BACT|nr:radical SAM family heme chaperone HemW [Hoylesella pleuritidis]ERJ98799.1 putative coproporphyrinogen dehydrogenase [Hoylesella pleuritidis F0068]
MAGIYIHVPFCASRCIYCGFYSTITHRLQAPYVAAIGQELALRANYLGPEASIDTVYIGGGTPSQLSFTEQKELFLYINKVYPLLDWPTMEVTMECNPDDITPEFADHLHSLPVNRISMGVQTFADDRLKFLHRRHKSNDITHAVQLLRKTGINNISIDLMFGFPEETLQEWQTDICRALDLNVEHISAYNLMFEENTLLHRLLIQNKVQEIDEELSLSMYNELIDTLTAAGYEHYEISNFALPGRRSLHNSSYWQAVPYIGLGASAHSYNRFSRQWNVSDIRQYIESINQGKIPMEQEVLDDDTRYDDLITTALRTSDGIDLTAISPTYKDYLMSCAAPYIQQQMIEIKADKLRLTRRGLFVSDMIMSDLMKV